jgi:hypothetical protein
MTRTERVAWDTRTDAQFLRAVANQIRSYSDMRNAERLDRMATAIDEERDALREALELACSWADIDLSKRNTVTSRGIAALIEGGDQRDIDAVRDIVQRRQQSKARSLSSVSEN